MAESHLVAKVSEIPDDEGKKVIVGETPIALFKLDGEVFAINDICTHAYASLSEGYIEDGCVECPLHAGLFDIKSGKAMGMPVTEDVATYPVRIEGDDVYVEV